MMSLVADHLLATAYALLPSPMRSSAASALLLAIGLQESGFRARRQRDSGPARSFWMFERAGLDGLQRHPRAVAPLEGALTVLRYPPRLPTVELLAAIEHNDLLAVVCARCLLWTALEPLPGPTDQEAAWRQYLALWRPGRPRGASWGGFYADAWRRVASATVALPTDGRSDRHEEGA